MNIHRPHRVAALLFVLFISSLPLAAQVLPPGIDVGDRVLLDSPTPEDGVVAARLVEVTPNWFAFSLDEQPGQVWTRRLAFVDTLVVGQGSDRSASALRGALWGAFAAGSVGAIVGPFTGRSIDAGAFQLAGMFGAAAGVAGAGVGALIGALWAPERWQTYVFSRQPVSSER